MYKSLLWLHQIDKEDESEVGNRAVCLGEIARIGTKTPQGFVINENSFENFLEENKLKTQFKKLFDSLDFHYHKQLEDASSLIRKTIASSPLNPSLEIKIKEAVESFSDKNIQFFTSFSSTNKENPSLLDSLTSFFVPLESKEVVETLKEAWGELFSPKSIFLFKSKGLGFNNLKTSVIFQNLSAPDASGVVYTKKGEDAKTKLVIKALWGFEQNIENHADEADTFYLDKKNSLVVQKTLGKQRSQLVPVKNIVKEIPIPEMFGEKEKLDGRTISQLAKIAKKIESHFLFPQEIYWIQEEGEVKVYRVQNDEKTENIKFEAGRLLLEESLTLIEKGKPTYPGIATGLLRFISRKEDISKIRLGDIVSIDSFPKNYRVSLKKAAGVLVNNPIEKSFGVSFLDFGKPIVSGKLDVKYSGQVVTLDGENGKILKGALPSERERKMQISDKKPEEKQIKTVTKVMISTGETNLAEELSKVDSQGVGLLRVESILTEYGDHFGKVIKERKQQKFINHLADQIARFSKAFGERAVIYRANDFETNEWLNFRGSDDFETEEKTSLIGLRGASRFIDRPNHFELEIKALKEARNSLGSKNLWLSIPFVRTIEELDKVKKQIASIGLHRTNSFKILLTLEVPATVLLIDQFLDAGVDGVVIDCTDLANLLLAIDPHNENLKHLSPLTNPAFLKAVGDVVKATRKRKLFALAILKSDEIHSELLETLVEAGISAISVPYHYVDQIKDGLSKAENKVVTSRK